MSGLSTETKAGILVGFVGLPFILAISAYSIFASAYVASCIWSWYAVPLGAISLSWKSWAGLSCLKAVVFTGKVSPEKGEKQSGWLGVAYVAAPWFTLLLAWWLK